MSLKPASAVVVMLFAGILVSSASGTTLCKVSTNPCPVLFRYAAGQAVTGSLKAKTTSVFVTETGTITCLSATLSLKTSQESAASLPGTATGWSFEGGKCEHSLLVNQCTRKEMLDVPYAVEIAATGGGGGTLRMKSSGNGNPAVWFKCENKIDCKLEKAEIVLNVEGGEGGEKPPAIASAKGLTFKSGGGSLCPVSESTWTTEYELSPSPLYIAASP